MSRRAPPTPAPFDPALAETRAAAAAITVREAGPDTFSAATLAAPGTDPPAHGALRASLAPPVDEGDDRYESGPLLGVGGMGEVRLHLDRRIGRPIALKTLRAEQAGATGVARFLREARVQGQLEHPSIVPVYDLGTDAQGRPYFTMKRVRGETLADILERLARGDAAHQARFSRHKLLMAYVQVCHAIQYAHARGVIHRDLKPGNIMLGDFGEVYVLDWGLAKPVSDAAPDESVPVTDDPSASMQVTRAGDVMGTPLYMAPEQLLAAGEVKGEKTDVYALGAILFEILTLSPYRTPDTLEKMAQRAGGERVELPSARVSGLPPELDALCAAALQPDPEARLGSAAELAEAVERCLEGARDEEARRAQAARLLADARDRLSADAGPEGRVAAMREALKALALAPDDVDVQRLLFSLVVDGSGTLPPDAERTYADGDVAVRRRGITFGIYGYLTWLIALPIAVWAGIRSATVPALLTVFTLGAVALALVVRRGELRSGRPAVLLSTVSATIVALSSCWLGPFVLAPLAACATCIMFVVHSTPRERPWLIGVWSVAAVAPFAVEQLGLVPPAYSFRAGELVLHARALELPPGPTILALVYTSVSFLVLLSVFVGRLRDSQRAAERRLFVQAWHLRQLFPSGG
jgi:serine/threonine-protein kinase